MSCGPKSRPDGGDDDDHGPDGPSSCALTCSEDTHSILDCQNNVVSECTGNLACDSGLLTCVDACTASESNSRSIGCDYMATAMDVATGGYCFAAFVANTWNSPAHITVKYQGNELPVGNFVRIPIGSGPSLTYGAYDPVAGLAANEVAILFLSGGTGASPLCPVSSAIPSATIVGTGIGNSFEIKTDVPVVAYQINPYGGGSAAVTAGSLLLPTSAWGTDYIAVNVGAQGVAGQNPSLNIIAKEDNTVATIMPTAAILGGNGVPSGNPGQAVNITLMKGQHVQITQQPELTGSTVTADKPIGFMAGQPCMNMPTGTAYCDHGEQMIPPVRALGSKNTGVMYRPRPNETQTFWRIIGAVDGTTLTWSTPVGGPATLARGQALQFETGTPFTVTSQDAEHPFMLFTYMSGSTHVSSGYGDPDFVYNVPPAQYLKQYVFFTDPTYPETNLVITRSRGDDGFFHDVTLDCLGPISGWAPVDSDLEFARVDLVTGNFQAVGACSTGRREIRSDAAFGLQVWGWGTPLTSTFTENVSYGYPGGMNVKPINSVIF